MTTASIASPAKTEAATPDWDDLLLEAVEKPGELASAFKHFRNYSMANRWLAALQMRRAGLPLQPINTFKGWLNANRSVQKGEKASIALIMPVPVKKRKEEGSEEKSEVLFTKFMLRQHWFHLGQTAGEDLAESTQEEGAWSIEAALTEMEITQGTWSGLRVDSLGYADGKTIYVSPLDEHPTFGKLREAARIVLGHTADTPHKNVPDVAELRDVEAEITAYLVAATLGLDGMAQSRAQIQARLSAAHKEQIPTQVAKRAFSAADKLVNAGYC